MYFYHKRKWMNVCEGVLWILGAFYLVLPNKWLYNLMSSNSNLLPSLFCRLAQLGDSHSGVLSCDCSQVAAGLESSESLKGLCVQERFSPHMPGTSAGMADVARGWPGASLSSQSHSLRLSWASSQLDGLRVDFWRDSRLPPEWVFQGSQGKQKNSLDRSSVVTWYDFYLMLVSQKLVTGKSRCKGRSIHIGRQGSLGMRWC